jgi:hypothetical protein
MKYLALALLATACSHSSTEPEADAGLDADSAASSDGGYLPEAAIDPESDAMLTGFGRDAGQDASVERDGAITMPPDGSTAGPDGGVDAGAPAEIGLCNPCSKQAQEAGLEPPCRQGLLCASAQVGGQFCLPYCNTSTSALCDGIFGVDNYGCVNSACKPVPPTIFESGCGPFAE